MLTGEAAVGADPTGAFAPEGDDRPAPLAGEVAGEAASLALPAPSVVPRSVTFLAESEAGCKPWSDGEFGRVSWVAVRAAARCSVACRIEAGGVVEIDDEGWTPVGVMGRALAPVGSTKTCGIPGDALEPGRLPGSTVFCAVRMGPRTTAGLSGKFLTVIEAAGAEVDMGPAGAGGGASAGFASTCIKVDGGARVSEEKACKAGEAASPPTITALAGVLGFFERADPPASLSGVADSDESGGAS